MGEGLISLSEDARDSGIYPAVASENPRFGDFLGLYRRASLLAPHMEQQLAPVLGTASETWDRLHAAPADLALTYFVRQRPRAAELVAAISFVRAWHESWLVQHLVVLPSADRVAAARLYVEWFDALRAREDAGHLVFFVRASNVTMTAFMERFIETVSASETVARAAVELWLDEKAAPLLRALPRGYSLRALLAEDEPWVQAAAEHWFGPLTASALDFRAGRFASSSLTRDFERRGLERARRFQILCRDGRPVFALCKECASPGVNLAGFLGAIWLLPRGQGIENDADAAQAVASAASDSSEGDMVLVPDGFPFPALTEAGLAAWTKARMYVLDRAAMQLFHPYARQRLDELSSRLGRRGRRRGSP